ncbi:MAG TPA: hypothetical protein DGV70_06370 [Faecalibacterium sp.]|nr:hypothetical protein [Faecalibacterium sp.]
MAGPLSLTLFGSSPKGGALGKERKFAWIAKASHFGRGGIAIAMTERASHLGQGEQPNEKEPSRPTPRE